MHTDCSKSFNSRLCNRLRLNCALHCMNRPSCCGASSCIRFQIMVGAFQGMRQITTLNAGLVTLCPRAAAESCYLMASPLSCTATIFSSDPPIHSTTGKSIESSSSIRQCPAPMPGRGIGSSRYIRGQNCTQKQITEHEQFIVDCSLLFTWYRPKPKCY